MVDVEDLPAWDSKQITLYLFAFGVGVFWTILMFTIFRQRSSRMFEVWNAYVTLYFTHASESFWVQSIFDAFSIPVELVRASEYQNMWSMLSGALGVAAPLAMNQLGWLQLGWRATQPTQPMIAGPSPEPVRPRRRQPSLTM